MSAGAGTRAASSLAAAQALLESLASVFLHGPEQTAVPAKHDPKDYGTPEIPNLEARYRTLVEQIPAVVFMVYLDRGIGEAYVSPHIEATLGFTQEEWLEDPIRWYQQIHPDDNTRWSVEAAEMFLTGKPLRSVYRVLSRSGRVVWFQCEAKVVRRETGEPWFIHGAAFDISDFKRAEEALEHERNFVASILNTVETLVVVLDPGGRVVEFNRTCEQAAGRTLREVRGCYVWELFPTEERRECFRRSFGQLLAGDTNQDRFECAWGSGEEARLISWSGMLIRDAAQSPRNAIFTGVDITESKRLEKAILDISSREQQRIGQDLHDGLGQHLTGIAFMSKVLEQKLAEHSPAEAADAARIVTLVNQAVHRTRELSRGLLPVVSDKRGLMSALEQLAAEAEDLFARPCRFQCDPPVEVYDNEAAMHLYHIAQEAVSNAIKHGSAKQVIISLSEDKGGLTLCVSDDGSGMPALASGRGMGLNIMRYRAKTIGGSLEIHPGTSGGMEVTCRCPAGKPPEVKHD